MKPTLRRILTDAALLEVAAILGPLRSRREPIAKGT
jgi:hypothetical protein